MNTKTPVKEMSVRQQKHAEIKAVRQEARSKIREIREKYAANPEKRERQKLESLKPKRYSIGEEIFNSVSHGVGAGLSVAATVLLVLRAVFYAPDEFKALYITSFAIFGASLFILYLFSTLYHALTPYNVKNVFQIFDHSSIYLLIAGTYTPYCLAGLYGPLGWTLFGIVWLLAVTGITFYSIFGNKLRALSAVTYVLMGWIIVFAFKPLSHAVPHITIVYLLVGGVAYTAGCPFYALKKYKWTHSIFHLFVLIGSVFHFFSVYYMI